MDHDDDGETSYNTFVDDVAFEPTYLQALLTAAGRNVATDTLNGNVTAFNVYKWRHSDVIKIKLIFSTHYNIFYKTHISDFSYDGYYQNDAIL